MLALVAGAGLLLAACGGATAAPSGSSAETPAGGVVAPTAAATAPTAVAPATTAPATPVRDASAGSAAPAPDAIAERPSGPLLDRPWATAVLTDARTGDSFRIADLAGRVVFIEPMAIWCTNCLRQQADAQQALARLDRSKVVYISLDVDPAESDAALKTYSERNGFDWAYAVAGPDVARALADDFGSQVLNPPSTPMIVIGSDGTITLTDFGHKSVDTIVQLAAAHGA